MLTTRRIASITFSTIQFSKPWCPSPPPSSNTENREFKCLLNYYVSSYTLYTTC